MTLLDGCLLFSFVPLGLVGLNLLTWGKPRTSPSAAEGRAISCLIPARNEEKNIEGVLGSILVHEEVSEVLVCDDGSTDGTAALVNEAMKKDSRVRLVVGTELPRGWVGKPHACHLLAREAKGEFLVFLDADVRLERGAIGALVEELSEGRRPRLATVVPRQEMVTIGEKLVLPFLLLTYLAWLPLFLVARGKSQRTVAACGQLIALTRSTYERIGGYEAVRDAIVDDVALCRKAKARGVEIRFLDGVHLASCRMYEGMTTVWRGFSKNVFEGLSRSFFALALAVALYTVTFVLPFAILPFVEGDTKNLALLAAALWLGVRLVLVRTHGQSLLGALLHPFGALVLVGIALNSARWSLSGRIEWAGRRYPGGLA